MPEYMDMEKKTKAKKPAPTKRPVGAPSKYSPEMAAKICALIADGHAVRKIGDMPDMPDSATIFRWLFDDRKPEFRELYTRAKEIQAETMADSIVSISDEDTSCEIRLPDGSSKVVGDSAAVARNRLRVEARKWVAAKLLPRKYGDKIQAEVSGADGGAIAVHSTVTLVRPPARPDEDE